MSAEPVSCSGPPSLATPIDRLRLLKQTVVSEAAAVRTAANRLDGRAVQAAEMTAKCRGCVMVTGVGKAGLVGQKLVATLASTGSPAHFLHPAEAVHGDLGRVRQDDVVWAISNSGKSEEVVRIAPLLRERSRGLIAFTADESNPLAEAANCVVPIGKHIEACPNGLAPTSSTAVMMAVGDGVAMLASQLRGFNAQDFARFHPGGALGQKLAQVDQMMRPLSACRFATANHSIRQAMVQASHDGRRSGAVMLLDDERRLAGIFTDSDLARLLEARCDDALDQPISDRMTKIPAKITTGALLSDAIALMSSRRISELPVVDADNRPLGMLDITDLVSLVESNAGSIPPTERPVRFGASTGRRTPSHRNGIVPMHPSMHESGPAT
ncbi:MAG: KpsF/GutQ family sugar-phosphate isomerase [Planctomycetota bacterium]